MKIRQLVPMVSVADVERSMEFYGQLGFEVGNTFTPERATGPTWAWLYSDRAQLMLTAAEEPVVADQQRVLFYIYTDDAAAARASVAEAGLNPGPITTPFYAPHGEFQLIDPDGYVVMVTHT
ncbi:MAG TPA: VOC family protein [Pyrinomonadaceae bacterium]|nr:VOC family protein [Pyrinomonadaceae bacterium]